MTNPVQEKSENFLVTMFDALTSKIGGLNSRSVVVMDPSCPQASIKAGGYTNEVVFEIGKMLAITCVVAAGIFGVLVAGVTSGIVSGSLLTCAITIGVGLGAIALAIHIFSEKNKKI